MNFKQFISEAEESYSNVRKLIHWIVQDSGGSVSDENSINRKLDKWSAKNSDWLTEFDVKLGEMSKSELKQFATGEETDQEKVARKYKIKIDSDRNYWKFVSVVLGF